MAKEEILAIVMLCVLIGLVVMHLDKVLNRDYKTAIRDSSGKCAGCNNTVSIRYYGSGRPLCQFCDDESMENNDG